MDCLSSPDVKNALDIIRKDFVVVRIDKATGNIDLVCKRFYASVINKELGLNNNSNSNANNNLLLFFIFIYPWIQKLKIDIPHRKEKIKPY